MPWLSAHISASTFDHSLQQSLITFVGSVQEEASTVIKTATNLFVQAYLNMHLQ